jgi:hypothetical protein
MNFLRRTATPWQIKIKQRIALLKDGTRKIVYLHQEPNQSTFRYRCFNMVITINATSESTSATWFYHDEIKYIIANIKKIDILILSRIQYDSAVSSLISICNLNQVLVVFDVDDLVINSNLIPEIVSTVTKIPSDDFDEEKLWNYWFSYVGRLRATMERCDAIFASTESLKNSISNVSTIPITVVENFIGQDQVIFSRNLYERKLEKIEMKQTFCLGYFSGSPSHQKDFEIALPGILQFLDQSVLNRLKLVGYLEIDETIQRNYKNQIEHLPLTDYLSLQEIISTVDLNLIPLQNNEFTQAKSVLKYFDAAIVGTLSLASPSGNLLNAINHDLNGFISSDLDWYSQIKYVASMEPEKRLTILTNAFNDASLNYTGIQSMKNLSDFVDYYSIKKN